jgi:hypothetical protein
MSGFWGLFRFGERGENRKIKRACGLESALSALPCNFRDFFKKPLFY